MSYAVRPNWLGEMTVWDGNVAMSPADCDRLLAHLRRQSDEPRWAQKLSEEHAQDLERAMREAGLIVTRKAA